jgi:hypothetical protein
MRLPLLTFGVLSCFSLNLAPLGDFSFDPATFGVLGSLVEDALDAEEDFGKVGGRPAGEARNKRFNH